MEEIFLADCSYYMSIGMTWNQYWYGDVWMVDIFRDAQRKKRDQINASAHLMGMYIYEALLDVSPIMHAFAKKGTKPRPYRTKPYNLNGGQEDDEEKNENREEIEKLRAEVYMRQMMRAGRNWGKGAAEK